MDHHLYVGFECGNCTVLPSFGDWLFGIGEFDISLQLIFPDTIGANHA